MSSMSDRILNSVLQYSVGLLAIWVTCTALNGAASSQELPCVYSDIRILLRIIEWGKKLPPHAHDLERLWRLVYLLINGVDGNG